MPIRSQEYRDVPAELRRLGTLVRRPASPQAGQPQYAVNEQQWRRVYNRVESTISCEMLPTLELAENFRDPPTTERGSASRVFEEIATFRRLCEARHSAMQSAAYELLHMARNAVGTSDTPARAYANRFTGEQLCTMHALSQAWGSPWRMSRGIRRFHISIVSPPAVTRLAFELPQEVEPLMQWGRYEMQWIMGRTATGMMTVCPPQYIHGTRTPWKTFRPIASTEELQYHHPHIPGGSLCMGDYATGIVESARKMDLAESASALYELLCFPDPIDQLGSAHAIRYLGRMGLCVMCRCPFMLYGEPSTHYNITCACTRTVCCPKCRPLLSRNASVNRCAACCWPYTEWPIRLPGLERLRPCKICGVTGSTPDNGTIRCYGPVAGRTEHFCREHYRTHAHRFASGGVSFPNFLSLAEIIYGGNPPTIETAVPPESVGQAAPVA